MIINEKSDAGMAIPIDLYAIEVELSGHMYRGVSYDADRTCDTYNNMRKKSPGKAIQWLKKNLKKPLKNIDNEFANGRDSHNW